MRGVEGGRLAGVSCLEVGEGAPVPPRFHEVDGGRAASGAAAFVEAEAHAVDREAVVLGGGEGKFWVGRGSGGGGA